MAATPSLSVVIPAHDEERVIERCLSALAEQVPREQVDVVVVANGCHDRTADVARSHPLSPGVLELLEGSKHRALNAGDAVVAGFPRLYLDADVVLGPDAVAALIRVLDSGDVHVAAPRPRFVLEGRPWLVRAYYRTWQRLPFLQQEPIGNGVYAVSEQGRRRWDEFPPVIADDLFVMALFRVAERRAVPGVDFAIYTPRTLRDLLAVRTRAYLGQLELVAEEGGEGNGGGPSRTRAVLRLVRRPRDVPEVVSYAAVSAYASMRAARRWRRKDTGRWDRDVSTR